MTRSAARPETFVGLGVIALAVFIVADTTLAPVGPAYGTVGPTAFPYGTGAALLVLGALFAVAGWRGGWRDPEAEAELGAPHLDRLFWVALGLLLNVVLIPWLGFTLSSTILFVCIARGFGSRQLIRDLVIGFLLALVSYVGFAKLLAIKLGEGVIERLF